MLDLSMVTALVQVGGTIATSVGSAIAGAIWNALLPSKLAEHVPGEYDPSQILGNLTYIDLLPQDQHDGASIAYGEVQKVLSIASLCLAAIALGFFFRMRPLALTEHDHHEEAAGKEAVDTDEQVSDDYSTKKE
jgi:hypothetical protein